MKLRVLVLYALKQKKDRITIDHHLNSFRRYGVNSAVFHYFNAYYGVPSFLTRIPCDAIILDYTFLASRFTLDNEFERTLALRTALKRIDVPKIAIAQDEYANVENMWRILREFHIETVFSCASKQDYKTLYPPKKVPVKYLLTVLPGYVDDQTVEKVRNSGLLEAKRPIDIGYRARNPPYWWGRTFQRKAEIGEIVKDYCWRHTNLAVDISTDRNDVFHGFDWFRFLLRCKAVLGTESGGRLMYRNWDIRFRTERYLREHPGASFDEVEKACFPGEEGKINYVTTSPRHFEAAMTKTCQLLLEGEYAGVLKPDVHYIPIKQDYSNLPEAIEKFIDEKYRNRIIENAYNDLVLSGKYSYRVFVKQVLDHIRKLTRRSKIHAQDAHRLSPSFLTPLSPLFHLYSSYYSLYYALRSFLSQRVRSAMRFLNHLFFLCIILPGSTIKQGLIHRKLWPFSYKSHGSHR